MLSYHCILKKRWKKKRERCKRKHWLSYLDVDFVSRHFLLKFFVICRYFNKYAFSKELITFRLALLVLQNLGSNGALVGTGFRAYSKLNEIFCLVSDDCWAEPTQQYRDDDSIEKDFDRGLTIYFKYRGA